MTRSRELPAGRYLGRVLAVETRHSDRTNADFLRWRAEVARGADRVEVTGVTPDKWFPGSKADRWAMAVDQDRTDHERPAFGTLYGKRVVVVVDRNANHYPDIVDLEPFTGDRSGLMPFAPSTTPARTPEPAQVIASVDRSNEPPF